MVDPVAMPEVTWKYRRLYTYGRTLIFSGLLFFMVAAKIHDQRTHREIALSVIVLLFADAFIYMCGAMATDITRLVKTAIYRRRAARKLP